MTTSDTPGADATPTSPQIAIRTRPPSPRRLSRKVLMGAALAAGSIVALALVSGLSPRADRRTPVADTITAVGGPPDSIADERSDYSALALPSVEDPLATGVDDLGPPRDPVLAATPDTAVRSPSGATNVSWQGDGDGARTAAADPQSIASASAILFARVDAQSRDHEVEVQGAENGRLASRLQPPTSPYMLQAGQIIPAALVTALNADLPGQVVAQVSAPVFDTVTGEHLLIPQGARLVGAYQSGARYGERRILLVWNRLVFPNGWALDLQGMPATDVAGGAGLTDNTDDHLDRLGAAVALSAVLSVVANEAEGQGDTRATLARSIGDAAAQQAAETGARIVDRELTVRPTLRVRAGAPVRVLVTRDMALRPYAGRWGG